MRQQVRRQARRKLARGLVLLGGTVLLAILALWAGNRAVPHASVSGQAPPTRPSRTFRPAQASPGGTSVPAPVSPTPIAPLIPVTVSAYTLEGVMADGKPTHVGACAVFTAQFPLGTILGLYNSDGSFNRQCVAEDTGSSMQYGHIDLAMPGNTTEAIQWGIRHLWARVLRRGWTG